MLNGLAWPYWRLKKSEVLGVEVEVDGSPSSTCLAEDC